MSELRYNQDVHSSSTYVASRAICVVGSAILIHITVDRLAQRGQITANALNVTRRLEEERKSGQFICDEVESIRD